MVYTAKAKSSFASINVPTPIGTTPFLTNYNINFARQAVSQVTNSISYDFWWPYPDLGSSGIITTTTDPSSTSTSVSPVAAVTPNEPNISDASNDQMTSTASLIYITAFPPATTLPQLVPPKLPYRPHSNLIYLAPLFAVLGIIFGVLTVTAWFKWRENRQVMRRSVFLEAGPPYAPPENGDEGYLGVHEAQSMEQVSLFAAGTPSKVTIHGSRYMPKRNSLWPSLGRSQYTAVPYSTKIIPSRDGERFTVVQEDPFVVTPSRVTLQSGKSTSKVSLPKMAMPPSLPLLDTTEHRTTDRSAQNNPDNQRIARRIMLGRGSDNRSTSLKHDGYVAADTVEDPCETIPIHHGSSLKRRVSTPTKGEFQVLRHAQSVGPGRNTLGAESDVSGGLSMTQDNAPFPERSHTSWDDDTPSEHSRKKRSVGDIQDSPKRQSVADDAKHGSGPIIVNERANFSVLHRKHSKRKGFRALSRDPTSTRRPVRHIHSSVLPRSPPLLMSPPLESALFFTSPLSSSVSLGRVAMHAAATVSPKLRSFESSPELLLFPLPTKRGKKKRPSRSPPPLPYPSHTDDIPSHATNVRSPSRSIHAGRKEVHARNGTDFPGRKDLSTSTITSEAAHGIWSLGSFSPTALAIALASSESFEALSKVNEIVARSYSEKQATSGAAAAAG